MRSGVAAALAAATLAQGLLLPPSVSEADVAAAEAVAEQLSPVTTIGQTGTTHEKLFIDCPGCPVPVVGENGKVTGMVVRPNHLEMAFSINHIDGKPDSLILNGIEFYPIIDPMKTALLAAQFVDEEAEEVEKPAEEAKGEKEDDGEKKKDGEAKDENEDLRRHVKAVHKSHRNKRHHQEDGGFPQRLGFSVSMQPPIVAADNAQLELIRMDLQIIELGPAIEVDDKSTGVGPAFIDGIPNIHIELVKSVETGRLMIAKVEATASHTVKPDTPLDGQPKDGEGSQNPADLDRCSSDVCRWLVALRAKLRAVAKKPLAMVHKCKHHKGKPAVPSVEADSSSSALSPEEEATRPYRHGGSHGSHGSHGYHGAHKHHWKKVLRAASHVLVPILVGIVAGVSVSLICVVIGTIFVSAWRIARGGTVCQRRRCCRRRRAAQLEAGELEAAAVEEKLGLVEHGELPPQYEAEVQTPAQDIHKADV